MEFKSGKYYKYVGDAINPKAYPDFRGWIFQAGCATTGWVVYPYTKALVIWAVLGTDIYEELTDEEVLIYKMSREI